MKAGQGSHFGEQRGRDGSGSDEGDLINEKGWLWGEEVGDRESPRMRNWVYCDCGI